MNGTLVFSHGGLCPYTGKHWIELRQTDSDTFTVTYGCQERAGLSYVQAARELGECIVHNLVCNGNIETNSEED